MRAAGALRSVAQLGLAQQSPSPTTHQATQASASAGAFAKADGIDASFQCMPSFGDGAAFWFQAMQFHESCT